MFGLITTCVLLFGTGVSSFFAIEKSKELATTVGKFVAGTFKSLFDLFPTVQVDIDQILLDLTPGDIQLTSVIKFDEYLVEAELSDESGFNLDRFCGQFERDADPSYQFKVNSLEVALETKHLFAVSDDRLDNYRQKRIWAWAAPIDTAAVVVGVFDGSDLQSLVQLKKFRHIIGVDLWDQVTGSWSFPDIKNFAISVNDPDIDFIQGDQSLVLPIVLQQLKDEQAPLGFVSIEASPHPPTYIANALNAFDNLVEGGVLVLNTCPNQGLSGIPLQGVSNNELLISSMFVMVILAGKFVLLEKVTNSVSYIAIRKIDYISTAKWNSSSNWMHPFGVSPQSLIKVCKPIGQHDLVNFHYLNVFGLGTRWERCIKCKKEVEVEHTSNWNLEAQRRLGDCN